MSESLKRSSIGGMLFLVAVLMLTGCGTPAQAQEPSATPVPSTASPAVTPPSAAAEGLSEIGSPSVAKLEALKLIVEYHTPNGPTRELALYEPEYIQEGDAVSVEDPGRAIVRFSDMYEVELYRGAEIIPERIRVDPDGYVFTLLKLMGDHMRAVRHQNMNGSLIVETDHAIIRLSEPETEVVMCHGDALTCITAERGQAEVEAQGEVTTLREGESTYVLKGQPPEPSLCTDQAEFRQWLDKKLGTGDVEPLGALVQRWPQEPCPGDHPAPTVTPPVPPLECSVIARALNLRDAPSTSHGHRIGLLRYGDHFEAVARNADGTWIEGNAQSSDQTGWVFARYVTCDGTTADLPVSE